MSEGQKGIVVALVFLVSAFMGSFASSISRGDEIRSMCRHMAVANLYYGGCENWAYVRELHLKVREDKTDE